MGIFFAKCISLQEKYHCILTKNFTEVCSWMPNSQTVNIGLGNGLVPQATSHCLN